MIGTLLTDKKGNPTAPQSRFQPSKEVALFTFKVKQDYAVADEIMHRPFTEFNDMSFIERMNTDQKAWNSYVEAPSNDPDDSWRFNGVRPITRNKVISIAAHVTASLLYPNVFAQNDDDEEDREAGQVMRDLVIWNIENSDYEMSFLGGVLGALVNPVTYMRSEFAKVMQEIKEKDERGKISKKEVVDEVLSGFQAHVDPADEVLLTNAYQPILQRQRAIVKRRFVDYDEAQALHGDHSNFEYVQPGVRCLYSEEDGVFYDQKDDALATLAEEVTYYNRREDTEVTFVNGIYMGDEDPYANPMKHRDYQNRPKYPWAKTGYELIDARRFAYYKSVAFKMASEQMEVDTMHRMVMDGTFLSVMPPVATIGAGKADGGIIFPAGVTNFEKGTEIKPIQLGAGLAEGWNAVDRMEQSMSDSSASDVMGGNVPDPQQKAFNVARAERNAKVNLGLFGKMIGALVKDFGELMIDDIIQHQTVGEVMEVAGDTTRMQYASFLLPKQIDGGKEVTKKIKFTDSLMDAPPSSFDVLKEEGGMDAEQRIYYANPEQFRKLRFKISVEPDELFPKNEEFEKMLKLEGYDRMIMNPLVDQEAATRDFLLEVYAKGKSDKYLRKAQTPVSLGLMNDPNMQQNGAIGQAQQPGAVSGRPVEQVTDAGALTGPMSAR